MRAGVVREAAPVRVEPPIRLRHPLALLACALVAWAALPRARAAWQLPTAATLLADYALCMVGPTGPALIRDNAVELRRLVRRRLVTSGVDERPFARCAKAARELEGSPAVERAHGALAADFVEYGTDTPPGPSRLRVSDLEVSTQKLADLAAAAWPFVRDGYTSKVKASAYAREAPHPFELPRAGAARGQPVLRPFPGGGRCETGNRGGAFVLGLSADRTMRLARSLTPEGAAVDAPLAPTSARVLHGACDDRAIAVLLGGARPHEAALFVCAYLGACTAAALPRFGGSGDAVRLPFDVARVSGITIVAKAMNGLVRVASSRDDGRSWTPFVVAFDSEAQVARFDVAVPDRLTVVGGRVMLHGASTRPSATYPVLVSDDSGASWRAP